MESLPDAMGVVIDWLYKYMLRCEITKESQWPDCALTFGAHILNYLQTHDTKYLILQKHHVINESLDKFKNMIDLRLVTSVS